MLDESALARIHETRPARVAFEDYWALGDQRTVLKLYELYVQRHAAGEEVPTIRDRTLYGWSSKFYWVARVASRTEEVLREREVWFKAARQQQVDDELSLTSRLKNRIEAMVGWPLEVRETTEASIEGENGQNIIYRTTIIQPTKWSMADVERLLKVWSKLRRSALGMDTGPGPTDMDDDIEKAVREMCAEHGLSEAETVAELRWVMTAMGRRSRGGGAEDDRS